MWGSMRYLATAVPGFGPLLAERFAALPRGSDVAMIGNDGRNDIVAVTIRGDPVIADIRIAEDVFVEVAEVRRPRGLHSLIESLTRLEGMERALSVYANLVKPLHPAMGYRVIGRILSERDFLRTTLRDALSAHIGRQRPRWVAADPGQLEFWVLEVRTSHFVLCLRLTGGAFRQRGGRREERPGALRPSVAAAMVLLAGTADEAATFLDPCCGSGTILAEGLAAGWRDVRGCDIDPQAVRIARRNVPSANVTRGDARRIPLPAGGVGALVANLPFGVRYDIPGDAREWLRSLLAETTRVVRPGGAVVLLTAAGGAARVVIERCAALAVDRRVPVQLLGVDAVLWAARVDASAAAVAQQPVPEDGQSAAAEVGV